MKIIVYDFETTGFLDKPNVQPTELAAMVIDHDGNLKTIHKYVQCPYPLDPIITEKTGITDDMCAAGSTLKEVMDEFYEELCIAQSEKKDKKGNFAIIGHNILNFDNHLYWMMRKSLGCDHYIKDQWCFDTGAQFKAEKMEWTKFDNVPYHEFHRKALAVPRKGLFWNLTAAGEHYEIKVNEGAAHSAIVDIQNNLQVFIKQAKGLGILPENLVQYEL